MLNLIRACLAALIFVATAAAAATSPLPPCWPSTWGGTGTELQSFANKNGQAFGWWCMDPVTGKPTQQGFHAARGYVIKWPPTLTGTVSQMAEAIWKANVQDEATYTPEIYALRAALTQNMAPTKPEPAPVTPPPPPPKLFKVMAIESVGVPTGSAKVSTLSNGALTTVPPATKTAPWGALCDCTKGKFIAADQAFCPFAGQSFYVARCQLQ